jgi:cell division protein FtsI/penicillin-binding protein 2
MIAAAVASGGEMPSPRLIDRAVGADGRPLPLPRPHARRVMAPEVAREVGRMMVLTTTVGTARSTFRDRRGRRVLAVDVAGKTGSLSYRGQEGDPVLPVAWPPAHAAAATAERSRKDDDSHLGYSWFVGYAPVDKPTVAFAVLIGNRALWHIKAPFLARLLVSEHLALTADPPAPGRGTASRSVAAR